METFLRKTKVNLLTMKVVLKQLKSIMIILFKVQCKSNVYNVCMKTKTIKIH